MEQVEEYVKKNVKPKLMKDLKEEIDDLENKEWVQE